MSGSVSARIWQKKGQRRNNFCFLSHLGGMSCSWSLTSSTNVPSEIDQLSSMQVMPNGQPRQAMAKGSARTPAPTIEVKLCLFSFVFCFFSSGFFVFRERGREAKATRPPPGSLRSPNLHLKPSHSPRTQKGPTRRAGTCPCGASPPPPWSVFFFNEKFGVERGTTTRAAATSARFLVCPFFFLSNSIQQALLQSRFLCVTV